MKTTTLLIGTIIALCTLSSCGTAMVGVAAVSATSSPKEDKTPLTEEEITALTKRVYSDHYSTLYPYLLQRLQATGCYIESSDKASGVVTAQFIERNKYYNRRECLHLSFLLIERPTGNTEVRLTIYKDELIRDSSTDINTPTVYNVIQYGMVTEKSTYDYWFKKLLES